jgi:hypothetical protein
MRFWTLVKCILGTVAAAGSLLAQADSRLGQIAAQQDEKATQLKPEQPNRIERALNKGRDNSWVGILTEGVEGFRPTFGGLAPGNGFGLGATYSRTLLGDGQLTFHGGARASFRGAYKFDMYIAAPKLANGLVFTELNAVHHNYPRMSFYGLGPYAEKSGRTDFRLEDTAVDGVVGLRPARRLVVGSSAGYVFNNIGPGTDHRYASSEQVYSAVQAPGIDMQSNFSRAGVFAQYDWRDNPDGPRRGGNYFAQFNDYRDRTLGIGNYQRLDMEAQQFVSILNQRRVFALRAHSALTFDDARPIPFYMQPSLGGSEDLRGYRP